MVSGYIRGAPAAAEHSSKKASVDTRASNGRRLEVLCLYISTHEVSHPVQHFSPPPPARSFLWFASARRPATKTVPRLPILGHTHLLPIMLKEGPVKCLARWAKQLQFHTYELNIVGGDIVVCLDARDIKHVLLDK